MMQKNNRKVPKNYRFVRSQSLQLLLKGKTITEFNAAEITEVHFNVEASQRGEETV